MTIDELVGACESYRKLSERQQRCVMAVVRARDDKNAVELLEGFAESDLAAAGSFFADVDVVEADDASTAEALADSAAMQAARYRR